MVVGHFMESLSNFSKYAGGSDDEIAIVSEDESSSKKNSKTKGKKDTGKSTNDKSSKTRGKAKSDKEEIDIISDDDTPQKKTESKKKELTKVAKKRKMDDDEDEESPEEQDDSGDEDYGSSKKKKVSKKSSSKKKAASKKSKKGKSSASKKSKSTARPKRGAKKTEKKSTKEPAPSKSKAGSRSSKSSKVIYKDDDEEEDVIISSDDDGSDFDEKEDGSKKKGKKSSASKNSKSKLPKPIAVSSMVIDSIKALGDNPKKGSSLRSIKETMEMNWSLNIKSYDSKIKKFITEAIDEGKIQRVKGSGFSGRFTIPGLKAKTSKKKAKKLGKEYDTDAEKEYVPKQSKRDEAREKDKEEAQKLREERWEKEEEKWAQWEIDNKDKPKKPKVEKEWEVEAIKSIKEKDDKKQYLVKFKGVKQPRWEPEENILNCDDAINEYIDKQNEIEKEKARQKKLVEEGQGEVGRILDVKFKKVKGEKEDKREFLIRWKGLAQSDDTWQPEDKLTCKDMIKKFMKQYDIRQEASKERELRDAPKKIERLEYASKTKSGRRAAKNGKGFRKTYKDMDDKDYKP